MYALTLQQKEIDSAQVNDVFGGSMYEGAGLFLTGLAMVLAPEVTIPGAVVAGAISGLGLAELTS